MACISRVSRKVGLRRDLRVLLERANAAARTRQQARGTATKKKRKPTRPVYDRAQINRRLTGWAAGDDFYMSA